MQNTPRKIIIMNNKVLLRIFGSTEESLRVPYAAAEIELEYIRTGRVGHD